MTSVPYEQPEGLQMYGELIAVHTIMRRGAALVVTALERLAGRQPVNVRTLVRVARWQAGFVRCHHAGEDDLFWPVLRRLFPDTAPVLDTLSAQHEALDAELATLSAAICRLGATNRAGDLDAMTAAAAGALPMANQVREALAAHLCAEEPVLQKLFPQVPDDDVRRLRAVIPAPRSGPDLVFGLMEHPTPAPGCDSMMTGVPKPLIWIRPLLLNRFRATRRALEG
jgi:hemerythrin-like domain-containing protein